jgi:predicted dehydrogenase
MLQREGILPMSSAKVLRFGMIGAGYMAKMHSLALRNLPGFAWPDIPKLELRRIADLSPKTLHDAAERWGWESSSTEWKDVTRADDIDAVMVLTPNDSHAELAQDAFKHGKHVFCEKPLAHTLEAARDMLLAARSSDCRSMVNYVYRNWPAIHLARDIIREGKIGEPVLFEGRFYQDYANDPGLPHSWRHSRKVAGSGAVGDIGSHIIDIACYLMGPVARVSARSTRLMQTRPDASGAPVNVDVDDLTVLMAEFSSGATGTIGAGWAMPGHKTDISFDVVGTKGALKFSWEHNNELMVYETSDDAGRDGFRRIVIGGMHPQASIFWYAPGQGLGYGEAFPITLRRFVESILKGENSTPSFEEAYHISAVVDATIRAAESGRWIEVDKPPLLQAASR